MIMYDMTVSGLELRVYKYMCTDIYTYINVHMIMHANTVCGP